MRILLDTHVVLWALADSPRLSSRARSLLADADNECWVSSASVWEVAIKAGFLRQSALERAEPNAARALEPNDLGHRAPCAGQDDLLARLRSLDQLRQRRLCLVDVDLAHAASRERA